MLRSSALRSSAWQLGGARIASACRTRASRQLTTSSSDQMPSPTELAKMLASDPVALHALMDALPADAKKQVGLKWAATELENEFAKADTDADGNLEWSEFRTWANDAMRDGAERGTSEAPATREQLRALFITSFLPFVGFGFTDNTMMVLFGDAIDGTIGLALGMSTMAAAAVGNSFSNGLGMVLHGTLERYMLALGMPDPRLTSIQNKSKIVKNIRAGAGILGVMSGCLLGMFPLLFLNSGHASRSSEEEAPHEGAAREAPPSAR